MKWYHLYTNHEGLRVGFLCVADSFDEAAAAADKLVSESTVDTSLWILDEQELWGLRESINKTLPMFGGISGVPADRVRV